MEFRDKTGRTARTGQVDRPWRERAEDLSRTYDGRSRTRGGGPENSDIPCRPRQLLTGGHLSAGTRTRSRTRRHVYQRGLSVDR